MGDFLIKEYDKTTENKTVAPKPHTAKKVIIAGLCVLSLGAAFVGGVVWGYRTQNADFVEFEKLAAESCAKRIKLAERVCKY